MKESSKRHEIHLVALSPPTALHVSRNTDRAVEALSAITSSTAVFPVAQHYRVRRAVCAAAAALRTRTFWESWYWSRDMHRHLRDLSARIRFDLVHADTVFLTPYLDALGPTPVVLNHHNVESHLLRRRAVSQATPWRRAFFERQARNVAALEREVVPRVAQNVVVSDLDGARLQEVAPTARLSTVPNGVDVNFFRASRAVPPDTPSLVFVGGMDWYPNRDAMEFFVGCIWPALTQDNPRRTMTIIGRNPPAVLLAASERPGLRVLGFVDDVRPHIEAAAIYVCPIRVGGGTRLKILDALAMSRPVVSTDLGVEGLGLMQEQHYLSANTPDDFVRQVRRLEGDVGLRTRLANTGREFVVQHYTWPRIAQCLEEAYTKAAATT